MLSCKTQSLGLLGGAFKAFENIRNQDPRKPNKGKYKMSQSPT